MRRRSLCENTFLCARIKHRGRPAVGGDLTGGQKYSAADLKARLKRPSERPAENGKEIHCARLNSFLIPRDHSARCLLVRAVRCSFEKE